MTKIPGITLPVVLMALAASLIIGACGQDAEPQQTAVAQPIQAPSAQPPTPSVVDATSTPSSSPSPSPTAYARFPVNRPTSFAPRSPDPTPTPAPATSPTAPPTRAPATVTATPIPTTASPTPTTAPTPVSTPTSDDPDDKLNVITLLPKDGIPAILDPTFIDATEAWEQYLPDEAVLGVSINGEHRAYSVPYLSSREIVNDEVGGVAIAATW